MSAGGKPAGRVADIASCPADGHGCIACTHSVRGPAVRGSSDIFIDYRPALRVGDTGVHAACCGPNQWTAASGSASVVFNGRPAHRQGDRTIHCGGLGSLDEGSSDVLIGDAAHHGVAAEPVEVPHERSLRVRVFDGIGRNIEEVRLKIFCPHREPRDEVFDRDTTLTGLCDDTVIVVDKQLQWGEHD